MLVQFVGSRNFHIDPKNIIRKIRGTSPFVDSEIVKDIQVFPGAILDLKEDFGRKMVKDYANDCVAYGVEEVLKEEKQIIEEKKDPKSNKNRNRNQENDPNDLGASSRK